MYCEDCCRESSAPLDFAVLLSLYMRVIPKNGVKTYTQACFDDAVTMNARGEGVQLPRSECFTHACRALWPSYGEIEASVVQAFFLKEYLVV